MIGKRLTAALVAGWLLAAVGATPVAMALGDPPTPAKPDKKGGDKPKGDEKPDEKPKADDPKPADPAATADVNILIIRATTKNNKIDDDLKKLAEKLKKDFKYSGFKVEKQSTQKTPLNQDVTADFKDCHIVVTPLKRDGDKIELKVVITRKAAKEKKDELVLSTTLTSKAGELIPLGGPSDGDDKLIIATGAK